MLTDRRCYLLPVVFRFEKSMGGAPTWAEGTVTKIKGTINLWHISMINHL